MKSGIRKTLIILSLILIVGEFIYGIPFLGGSIIFSFGWQPLLINALLYFVIVIILVVDKQNSIKPMLVIPLLGVFGSFLAFVPFVGMIVHWILFFLMLFFVLIIFSTPLYVPNKHAKVVYTQHKQENKKF